jgi:hypothetical protein
MSVTFTASTLGPTASSFSLTSSSGVTGSGASSPLTLQEAATGTYTYSVSGTNANGTGPSSAASNSVVVTSVFSPSGAYEPIASVVVPSGGLSSITFGSIPQTYTHLQVRFLARTSDGSTLNLNYRLNNDSGSNYAWHRIFVNGTSVGAGGQSITSYSIVGQNPGSSVGSNIFGVGLIDFLDYSNTNKFKTSRALTGYEENTGNGAAVQLWSGLWQSTNAITSMLFYLDTGNFVQNSQFALYGIKG